MKTVIAVIILYIAFTGTAQSKLYKWVDENGVTHFSNVAPPEDHDQVHAQEEAKGQVATPSRSPGIQHVLDSYKKDEIKYKLDNLQKRTRKSSGKSENLADHYAHRIKEEEAKVKEREQDLEDVKRESFSDSIARNKRVRFYEERFERAKLDLEEVESKYKKAKYGR